MNIWVADGEWRPGTVTLRAIVEDQSDQAFTIRFEVEDPGLGIKPNRLAEALEPFTPRHVVQVEPRWIRGHTRRLGSVAIQSPALLLRDLQDADGYPEIAKDPCGRSERSL